MATIQIKACEDNNTFGENYTSCSKDERGEKKPQQTRKTTMAHSFFIKFSHVSQMSKYFQSFQLT